MLKFANLRLYRKFLILAVLLGGVFAVTSINKVGAMPCCQACEDNYNACVDACYSPNPQKMQECVDRDCNIPFYLNCFHHCDPFC